MRQRQTPTITPDVALDILQGSPTPHRDQAREHYLRTLNNDELFDWFTKSIRALLLRHPKHGALIVEMAQSAGEEFGVSSEQVDIVRRA